MILVLGATGTNGKELVARLAAGGHPVRALVRDPAKAARLLPENVELVAGDLDDPASIVSAFDQVDRAFFLATFDPRFVGWFTNFLGAVGAGRPSIVKFSAMGAAEASSVEILRQHGETDSALIASGLPSTILRPNSFHQNLLWSAGTIRDHGAFYLPIGDAAQSLVDVRDITSVAFEALTKPGHQGKIYELTGPESLTYHEVAKGIADAIGKPVRYVPVPPEAALDSMKKAGTPEWNARALIDLYTMFAAGDASRTTGTIAEVLGRPPISFAQFAREHAGAFS